MPTDKIQVGEGLMWRTPLYDHRKGNMRLLTPGPLAIHHAVKQEMIADYGSRDSAFNNITSFIRSGIARIAGAVNGYTVIPIQGSGTFAIEAALATFLRTSDKVLICGNGIYGTLAAKILRRIGLPYSLLEFPFNQVISVDAVRNAINGDASITHLYFAYCETTAGIANPYHELLELARTYGLVSIVDAMSAFGAMEVDADHDDFDIMVSSGNKCLEAPPGIAFAIVRRSLLLHRNPATRTYSLDLRDQWRQFEETGEWRSTPPTHVAQALAAAVLALQDEGISARRRRYTAVRDRLIEGMGAAGIKPVIPKSIQSPIAVAFSSPRLCTDERSFKAFYEFIRDANLLIYARFQPEISAIRIGCIGQVSLTWIDDFLDRVTEHLKLSDGATSQSLARQKTQPMGTSK